MFGHVLASELRLLSNWVPYSSFPAQIAADLMSRLQIHCQSIYSETCMA